jgi:nucleoside-diphosphate-sugar epimerase
MILVTGNRGYLGSVLTKHLENWKDYDLADEKDVLDSEKLRQSLDGVDSVIHLAGVVGERACSANPLKAFEVNSVGTLNLVDLARRMNINKLITVSTCAVYGKAGIYSHSKLLAEVATRGYGYMVVRLGSLYGGNGGSDSLPEIFKRDAKKGKITVYGKDGWRPLLHVEDAVRALLYLLPKASTPHKFDVVGENMTKGELASLIAERYGAELEFVSSEDAGYVVEGKTLRDSGFKYKWNMRKWLNDSAVEAV